MALPHLRDYPAPDCCCRAYRRRRKTVTKNNLQRKTGYTILYKGVQITGENVTEQQFDTDCECVTVSTNETQDSFDIAETDPTAQSIPGDVDGNGEITLKGAALIQRYIVGGWGVVLR